MRALRTELHEDMAALRTELHGDMTALRTEVHTEISGLNERVFRFGMGLLIAQAGMIAAMLGLIAKG
jgi:hypothetical protein